MMTGRDALQSLQGALMGVRRDEDRLVAMLNSATEEAARLRAREADAYRTLARLKLDALARDEIDGQLDSAERQALLLLDRRKDLLAKAAEQRQGILAKVTASQDVLNAKAERVEAAAEMIEALRGQTEARLKNDGGWKAALERVVHADHVAAAAEEKAARSEAEKDGKKKPYEADSLFMYLWRRGYGTSAYKAGFMTRFFDGKVAELINFEPARANFYMLTEIPKRLRDHATRLKDDIAVEQAALEAYERGALEADGVKPLEVALEAAERELKAAEATLAGHEATLKALDEDEHAALNSGTDPQFQKALDLIAGSMARDDLRQLYNDALRTPTPEDEKIVKQLQDLRHSLARVDSQIEETRKAAIELSQRRGELEQSQNRFRQSGYDDPFGGFINENVIGQVIAGVIKGALSSRDLDKVWRDNYTRRAPPRSRDTFGGGIRLPSGDAWRPPSGGGFGGGFGGGSGGGGGGSSGGFKTGGGF